MNLPNRITLSRIILTIFIIFILLFPFYAININLPKYNIKGIIVDTRYVIAGVLFIIASLSDLIDGHLARKTNQVTDTGKLLDAIADKVLVNSVLVIFTYNGFISPIVAVIYIFRDEVVNALRMHALRKGIVVPAGTFGKIKTCSMMMGLSLMFFYNLPFELFNINISDMLLIVGTVLAIISCIQYYNDNKKKIKKIVSA